MPERCVVYGCNNTASSTKGISLYRIPYWDDSRQIARSRRKKWEDFIRRKRDKWLPSVSSVVCSEHFAQECFEYGSSTVEKYKIPKLKRDEVGVTAVPSLLPKATSLDSEQSMRIQNRGKLCIYISCLFESRLHLRKDFQLHGECSNCKALLLKNKRLKSDWLSAKNKLEVCRMQIAKNSGEETHPSTASRCDLTTIVSDDEQCSSDIGIPPSDDFHEEDCYDEETPEESTETETDDETNPQHK
ncbi:THAP domain-containing 1-like, partial [Paramuricea clavata]